MSARLDDHDVGVVVSVVGRSRRYRDVDPALVTRLAAEELGRSSSLTDAVKRTKRRLHQAVGAFRPPAARVLAGLGALRAAWRGELDDPAFRHACATQLAAHASTRERVPYLSDLYARAWEACGDPPRSVLDLGCGIGPLALPWMRLAPSARYVAVDVDRAALALVDGFLSMVGQPHDVVERDLAALAPWDAAPFAGASPAADAALLLKLVPTLDRQEPRAAARLLSAIRARNAVVSFPARTLGGRARGMDRTYRARLEELVAEMEGLGTAVRAVTEASVPGELVFVLAFAERPGA